VSDLVVVGGGVIGLSSAWMVAETGRTVCVVDPEPGRGASWVAAGMLAAVSEAHYGEERLTRLLVLAASRWPDFAARLEAASDLDLDYRPCGAVGVAVDHSDRAALDELLAFQLGLGLSAERLSASACRQLVPALAPRIAGGATFPEDHQVDNRRLVGALVEAAERAGVRLVRDRAAALIVESGRVAGVELEAGGRLAARTVLVAAGSWSGGLAGLDPGTLPPVRPVKGHVLRLRGRPGDAPLLERTVRGLVEGRSCYLVPRSDGSLVIGATVEERGFDTSVQAGAVHALLDDARRLVPGIDELELVECLAGLRPGSPDNAPSIGWTRVEGLAAATGHYRNGILLTPVTAEAVVALLTGSPLPAELGSFDAQRHLGAGVGS
jgi:glycine oxidase